MQLLANTSIAAGKRQGAYTPGSQQTGARRKKGAIIFGDKKYTKKLCELC